MYKGKEIILFPSDSLKSCIWCAACGFLELCSHVQSVQICRLLKHFGLDAALIKT